MGAIRQYDWDSKKDVLKITKTEELVLSPTEVLNDLQELLLEKGRLQSALSEINTELQRLENIVNSNRAVFDKAREEISEHSIFPDKEGRGGDD